MILVLVNCEKPVKGITHCLLPECDRQTWPFKNYCNKEHAIIESYRVCSHKKAVGKQKFKYKTAHSY